MPEWRAEIRRRLEPLRLPPAREEEIVEEVAQHLDDCYRELRASGRADEEAAAKAEANKNLAAKNEASKPIPARADKPAPAPKVLAPTVKAAEAKPAAPAPAKTAAKAKDTVPALRISSSAF